MAGLLGDVLPAVYSASNVMKNKLRGLLDDPLGTLQQALGDANDRARSFNELGARATAESEASIKAGKGLGMGSPANQELLAQLADAYGPVGMAKPLITPAERASRMQAMGMERGWFRGGEAPNAAGNRTGPWYTQDEQRAAGYAQGRGGDVREYAVPNNRLFDSAKNYPHQLPNEVAKIVSDPYYGDKGKSLAKELMTYGPGEGIQGGQLWASLKMNFGDADAADILSKLGKFNGAKNITAHPADMVVFKNAPVRDANEASFILSDRFKDDIYGKASLPMMGLLGGTALGGSYLLHKD